MKDLRILGSMIHKLSEESHINVEEELGWTDDQTAAIFEGRIIPSFPDLQKLSDLFGVTVSTLLNGDEQYYNQNVVHCMGSFEDENNREIILDIIDDYLVLLNGIR